MISGKALRQNVRVPRLGTPPVAGLTESCCSGLAANPLCGHRAAALTQVQNGGKVFAETSTPKKTGSKTQIGRWKGLDEDVSDDQVCNSRPLAFVEKGVAPCRAVCRRAAGSSNPLC